MKISILLLSMILSAVTMFAESVKLKITYKGNGISGHNVTVMIGDASIGSGTTDDDGNVTISVSSLPTKSINLKGEKTCEGARKSWEVKGFVTLDGSNFAHLKMEEPIAEMVEASGGFMSESMMVASYGLICNGSGSSSSSNSGSSNASSSDSDNAGSSSLPKAEAPSLMTREESLANQKLMLENKVANIDYKITKKNEKIASGKLDKDKIADAEQDVKEWTIEKQIAENDLEKVNLTIEKGMLNKAERGKFKDKEDALKEELKQVKNGKSGSSGDDTDDNENNTEESSENESDEEDGSYEVKESELADMNNLQLKKKKLSLNSALNKKKIKLKTKKAFLSPNELTELEAEILQIETSIELLNQEIEKRGGEKEGE